MGRRSRTVAKAATIIMVLCLSGPAADRDSLTALEQGDDLFRAGKFSEAEAAYNRALPDDDTGQAVLRLGEIALMGNRFAEAEPHLKQAIKLRPADNRPKLLLAEAYYRQDRLTETASLFREAGRNATADTLASFEGLRPYEIIGPGDITRVKFVQTDPLPVIKTRFNDTEEALLIVDTGASELYLDERFAVKLKVPQFGSTTGTFAGGRQMPVGHGRLDSIQLGDFTIKNLPVIVQGRRPLFEIPGQGAPVGVIGTVVFYHFFATLDYPNGELVLRRKTEATREELARQAESPGTHVVPFWMAGTHFMVAWGAANDSEPFLMFADTGLAGGGFSCPESTVKAAGVDLSGLPSFEAMGGGGPIEVTPFTMKRLSFGDASRSDVPCFSGGFPPQTERDLGFHLGGIISHGFFRPYALTFDFEKMRFLLVEGAEAASHP